MLVFAEMETAVRGRRGRWLDEDGVLVSFQEEVRIQSRCCLRIVGLDVSSPTRLGDSPFLTAGQDNTPSNLGKCPGRGKP